MGLTYCQSCQSVEGGTHTNNDEEDVPLCDQCGSDEIDFVPEHDEMDMER